MVWFSCILAIDITMRPKPVYSRISILWLYKTLSIIKDHLSYDQPFPIICISKIQSFPVMKGLNIWVTYKKRVHHRIEALYYPKQFPMVLILPVLGCQIMDIPSTLNIDLILWHTQSIICVERIQSHIWILKQF